MNTIVSRKDCRGFTLVEMLVVIAIIGILAATLIGSFSAVKTMARQTQAQALANETAAALTYCLQSERAWPDELSAKTEMDDEVCCYLASKHYMDISTNGLDRFGLLDPWGRAALRRNPTVTSADAVIDGIKLSNHRIQYRLDLDLNGYINSSEDSPQGVTIRASAIAWSRGSDGEDDFNDSSKRYPDDDRLSWSHGAAKKEK